VRMIMRVIVRMVMRMCDCVRGSGTHHKTP
jgi:hypothetical protein